MKCNHEAYMLLCASLLEWTATAVHEDTEAAGQLGDPMALGIFGGAEQSMLATANHIKTAVLAHRHVAHGNDPGHLETSIPWAAGLVSAVMTTLRVYVQTQDGNPTG